MMLSKDAAGGSEIAYVIGGGLAGEDNDDHDG